MPLQQIQDRILTLLSSFSIQLVGPGLFDLIFYKNPWLVKTTFSLNALFPGGCGICKELVADEYCWFSEYNFFM